MRGVARRGTASTLLACLVLVISALALPQVDAATATTTSATAPSSPPPQAAAPASLVLTVIPPKLPADGGSYRAIVISLQGSTGKAVLATGDTTVYLTSSQESVGSVSGIATIQRGSGFALANFTTTATPGTTSISASSVGLSAAAAAVTTVNPSGFANRLKVIPIPGSQLLVPGRNGTVLVETLDSAGLPAKASSDVTVTLSSSNINVVDLPYGYLTVPSGSVLAWATYYVGVSSGAATITGSASGFASAAGTITVLGSSPFALKIFAQPDPMTTSASGRLVVTLTDAQGKPARAPAPIKVAISSSNTSVISSGQTATIVAGQSYAVAPLTSGTVIGTANITASSPGLQSDFAVLAVAAPAQPVKLKLIVAPNPVLADGGSYDAIVVALTDASGNPGVSPSDVAVTLTSSNAAVGNVVGTIRIPAGSSYAVGSFVSTFFVGSSSITALAQNLQSTAATVSSYGPIPTQVVVKALPSSLPADGAQYPTLAVMLEDANGLPAVAPAGLSVQLASSGPDVAMVNSTVIIGAGQSYILAYVTTTLSTGVANITASSSGFTSSSTGLSTTRPAPSQLGLYVAPAAGMKSLGSGGDAILAVQLQDSTGSPARARQGTQVVVTSSDGAVISKPLHLDIPAGSDFVSTIVNVSQAGSSVLTASSGGLASASASISELSAPVTLTLTSSAPLISMGMTASLQLQVSVMGSPFGGAEVTLSTTSGRILVPSGVTDPAGSFSDTFVPQQNGVATITALVRDPILGNLTAGTNILVTLSGVAQTGGTTSKGLGSVGTILPIAVVVIVVAIILLGARRVVKSRRGESEDYGAKGPERALAEVSEK